MSIQKIPKVEYLPIWKIQNNPNNPRIVKNDKFKKLVQSIKDLPEMLDLRPIIVNEDLVVLGGNMRLKASKDAGLKEVPVIVTKLSEEKQREFIIKDNLGYGEWNWEMIANEWDAEQLIEWGMDIPKMDDSLDDLEEPETKDCWFLNIEFENEQELQKWYDKLIEEGLICKIVQ